MQRFLTETEFPANEWARLYAESGAAAFGVVREELAGWVLDVVRRTLPENASVQARLELARSLQLKDLALARACARGSDAAWDHFLTRYREKLYVAAIAIARDEVRGRELADSLYAELYGTRVSKLDSFFGRGSLEGWLKTLLAQEHVNRFRRERRLVVFDDALETPGRQADLPDPGLSDQQAALSVATDTALSELDEEARFLLVAYYLDQRTLAEIGRMTGMHESTVSRRLEKTTAGLRKRIIGKLCSGGLPKRAAEEMLELDVRDLAINVREKLAQERRA